MKKNFRTWLGLGLSILLLQASLFPVTAVKASQAIPSSSVVLKPKLSEVEKDNRLVVKLSDITQAEKIADQIGATIIRKGPLNYVTLSLPEDTELSLDLILEKLKKMPSVSSAEKSTIVKAANLEAQASGTLATGLNEPQFSEQWGLATAQVPKAWELGATGKGITIAIVDTGVDLNHPDLKDNLVQGYNAITGSTAPKAAQDNNGHGTHVAGIAAAALNNAGIIGVAYEAKIMPVKVMDRHGEGMDDVISDGVIWAADHGAKIINLSLGSDIKVSVLTDAIKYATDKGALVIAAAGNKEGKLTSGIAYPATDPNVLAVTASDKDDRVPDFSLTGPEAALAAPGVNILSDYWSSSSGSGMANSDGTSMSSPFVAGVAALVWSKHPDWGAKEVKLALLNSARDIGGAGRDNSYGYGIVNAYWAVKLTEPLEEYPSPANITWTGGIVKETGLNPGASLKVPARAFGLDSKLNVNVAVSRETIALDFPAGISPASPAFTVNWSNGEAKKMLSLTISNLNQTPSSSQQAAYLYRLSGNRWIRVGGGMAASASLTVGVTMKGTYRVGFSELPDYTRIFGEDRLKTAIQIAKEAFPTGADTVILARSDDFPDALAGVPLAFKLSAPILLTNPKSLDSEVLAAIQELAPKKIILLGGEGAISASIPGTLGSIAQVERLWGSNRYETAGVIAQKIGSIEEAVLVSGENFPDAISVSSVAAAKGIPILLTPASELNLASDNYLRINSVTKTTVIGGSGVVKTEVANKLPNHIRLAGDDRYGTAAAVLQANPPQGKLLYIATGENFPDALTGGVLAALQSTNVLLVQPQGPTSSQLSTIQTWQGKKVKALGGKGAVPDTVIISVQNKVN